MAEHVIYLGLRANGEPKVIGRERAESGDLPAWAERVVRVYGVLTRVEAVRLVAEATKARAMTREQIEKLEDDPRTRDEAGRLRSADRRVKPVEAKKKGGKA